MRAKNGPLFVLTSNGTRDMTDALRRRCLHAFVDYLRRRASKRSSSCAFPVWVRRSPWSSRRSLRERARSITTRRRRSRRQSTGRGRWCYSAQARSNREIVRLTLGALVKHQDDRETVETKLGTLLGT